MKDWTEPELALEASEGVFHCGQHHIHLARPALSFRIGASELLKDVSGTCKAVNIPTSVVPFVVSEDGIH